MSGSITLGNQGEVLFHPDYSCGTAAIRGEEPFELGCQHYWEIKMTSAVYGTDMVRCDLLYCKCSRREEGISERKKIKRRERK